MGLWIRLLGSFGVFGDGVSQPQGDGPAGLLAMLALHAGQPVSEERVMAGLFEAGRPAWARRTLQVYVARLRLALGPHGDRVERGLGSYRLLAGPDEVDVARFDALLREGTERSLHHALSLWHGDPLGDLRHLPFAAVEIERLRRRRANAMLELDDLRALTARA
jgi:DNA-binding SARP family transcriptional activator